MTTAHAPVNPTTAQNDSRSVKVWVAIAAILSTSVTAGINGLVNVHFASAQADEATRKGDVRKLEDMIQSFDMLARVFVTGVVKDKVSEMSRTAVLDNIQQQHAYTGTLMPLLKNDTQREAVEGYRAQLVRINGTLRRTVDVSTAMKFAQAASNGVDARIAAVKALRESVGLPVEAADQNAQMPVTNFGTADE